jgi:hypothetical protein
MYTLFLLSHLDALSTMLEYADISSLDSHVKTQTGGVAAVYQT